MPVINATVPPETPGEIRGPHGHAAQKNPKEAFHPTSSSGENAAHQAVMPPSKL